MKPLYVDCNNLIHIAINTTGHLTSEEMKVGAIFGFFRKLKKIAENLDNYNFYFCFDSRETFRKKKFPDYKRGRKDDLSEEDKKKIQEAYRQLDQLREEILPFLFGKERIFFLNGFEGDDIMGILSDKYGGNIISTDKDLFQCLKEDVNIYNPVTFLFKTKIMVEEEFKINCQDWYKVKALAGKPKELEGIEGVGIKKAISYLKGELPEKGKIFKNIKENNDIFERNLPLAKIPFCTCKLYKNKIQIKNPETPPDLIAIDFVETFEKFRFASFINEFVKWKSIFRMK